MGRHFSSRELKEDAAAAQRASRDGFVIISEDGKPAQVLVSWDEWRRVYGAKGSLAELLSCPGTEDIDLDALIGPRTIDPHPFEFDDEPE